MRDRELAEAIARAALALGGRTYAVGGWVRDRILGLPGKDLDLEVHGISDQTLRQILAGMGTPLTMGKAFSICSLAGTHLDIALPRDEDGRPAPGLSEKEAARRRDFTCNAMMEDLCTGEVLDFFGGRADLQQGILRHIEDRSFRQDPLRVLRGARFCARYGWALAPETAALCRSLDLSGLPRERVWEELRLALTESTCPSRFFEILRELQQLDAWFPELQALIGVPQPPRHHSEGDVWNHTMLVLDQAAGLSRYVKDPFCFLLAALCHDFGKVSTTQVTEAGIHAYGHEAAGVPLAGQFLSRLTNQKSLITYVQNLVRLHMQPGALAAQHSSQKAYNRMFDKALDPEALLCLAAADNLGRISQVPRESPKETFLTHYQSYQALMAQPQVTGADLIAAGIRPGKDFSAYLAYAHKLHLSGADKASALRQTLSCIKNHP